MSKDVNCPYCGEGQEIIHDDGYGYAKDRLWQQVCGGCDKTFTFTTSIHFYYEAMQAPCLNGGEHEWQDVPHVPRYYPDWKCCKSCGGENKGRFCEAVA